MEKFILIALLFIGLMWVFLFVFVVFLHKNLKKISESFGKIGYLAREDTKRYFKESSDKAIEVFAGAAEKNKEIIGQTMQKVLIDSASVVKESISSAEREASLIITEARKEAVNIKKEAEEESNKYFDKIISDAVQAVDWSVEQFIKDNYSVKEHEDIVRRLINIYVDEHRKS
jgi:vacuolar-type H+-ATPase subunit H